MYKKLICSTCYVSTVGYLYSWYTHGDDCASVIWLCCITVYNVHAAIYACGVPGVGCDWFLVSGYLCSC
jgi:hypothetical protein